MSGLNKMMTCVRYYPHDLGLECGIPPETIDPHHKCLTTSTSNQKAACVHKYRHEGPVAPFIVSPSLSVPEPRLKNHDTNPSMDTAGQQTQNFVVYPHMLRCSCLLTRAVTSSGNCMRILQVSVNRN